jgi:hypothetical protein
MKRNLGFGPEGNCTVVYRPARTGAAAPLVSIKKTSIFTGINQGQNNFRGPVHEGLVFKRR